VPKTDYLLIDKLIVYCKTNNIEPYIVINKIDLYSEDEIEDIIRFSGNVVSLGDGNDMSKQ